MKIRIYSDLHLEFAPFEPPPLDCDLVILAGDIHINRNGLKWALASFPSVPVVYVLGNHEYYGRAIPKLTDELRAEADGTNVHVLDCDLVHVGAVRILGCTLWTDFALQGDPAVAKFEAGERMTDYKRIRVSPSFGKLRPLNTVHFHARSFSWLSQEMMNPHPGPTIVVTHHAPSARSLPVSRLDDVMSAAYASDCEQLIKKCAPDLWVHGHVHARGSYTIGRTRVVCNPRGYPDEPVEGFDPGFVVELIEELG